MEHSTSVVSSTTVGGATAAAGFPIGWWLLSVLAAWALGKALDKIYAEWESRK